MESGSAAKGIEEVDWALSVEALWAVIEGGLLRSYVWAAKTYSKPMGSLKATADLILPMQTPPLREFRRVIARLDIYE